MDIVERLTVRSEHIANRAGIGLGYRLAAEAAEEIERLRKELATAQKDKAMADGLLKIAIADCNTAMNDRAGAISVIADIRMKTGVGVKPMLDELADAIVDKIDEAHAKSTIETMSADAIHAIRKILDELGVPKAAFIDDHVMNGLVWARKQGLEEAAKVVDDFQVPKSQNDGDLKPRRYPSQASTMLAAAIRKLMEPRADD